MSAILLLGSEGQIGWELQRALTSIGVTHGFSRQALDLADKGTVERIIRELRPSVIVNAAAYTAVDRAEQDEAAAMKLNAEAPAHLAMLAKEIRSLLIHYSTDYIFDGTSKTPYLESATPSPLNVYGASKLAGEEAIRHSGAPHLILRTSWIYACRGKNFLRTMLDLARHKAELSIVNDQFGAPTWARLVAQATAHLALRCRRTSFSRQLWGTYHLTCQGQTSWYGFASAIFEQLQQFSPAYNLPSASIPKLHPISSAQYPTPAARPAYSVLDNSKLHHTFDIQLSDWQAALGLCMHELLQHNIPLRSL